MKKIEEIDIRSEEVQEILGTPPVWLVRWGSTVALISFAVILWVAYWIKYPDVVEGEVKVTSTEPPRKIYTETTGYIDEVLVKNEELVDSGEALIAFRSPANLADVMVLEDHLALIKELNDSFLLSFNPPRNLILGDIQQYLYDFFEKQEAFRSSLGGSSRRTGSQNLRKRITDLQKRIQVNNLEKRQLQDELEALSDKFSREQKAYRDKKITLRQLRATQDAMSDTQRSIKSVEADNAVKNREIAILQDQIKGNREENKRGRTQLSDDLQKAFFQLQNSVEEWKKKYVISSPIKGIVAFTNEKIGTQQFLIREEEILSIIPTDTTETLGRMLLSIDGSGKVQEKQKVIVKFNSYPSHEFGAVIGEVSWKGKVPANKGIPIEIRFPNGLVTTRGKAIDPQQEMIGKAEIITSDKRFFEKIFEGFRREIGG